MNFKLISDFKPKGDQQQAIDELTLGLKKKLKSQVLLGVTGSGKTFTMANVIQNLQKPTLVISPNKTLAAQLYQEFRDFFPQNAVCYFVSYYDYYQPEAYLPQTDTYIEKEAEINEQIDKLRLEATTNLLTRKDTIVIASVSCIYNLGSPVEYGKFVLELRRGMKINPRSIIERLVDLQYQRTNFGSKRNTFRVFGDRIDLFPAYSDQGLRFEIQDRLLLGIKKIDPLNGNLVEKLEATVVYPAKHYMTDPKSYRHVFNEIRNDLKKREQELFDAGKSLEAYRLRQKTEHDLEMINELGYVNGIENYSRYFDDRRPGQPPYTLLDYFNHQNKNWLLFIDESHLTIPQIRGMYLGDKSRKQTLIDYGFRLPSCLDNRPLKFNEFFQRLQQIIYVSATPADYEINQNKQIVEQLLRPTGLVDPQIIVRPTIGQIDDLIKEIIKRLEKKERTLVTTLTKKMAEILTEYLNEKKLALKIKVTYLHSDIETLKRTDILEKLRRGDYDVLIGINLLREGLDLPEVSLVAILDADKEGFLRSTTSLIQTMGRAARHLNSQVIMYADKVTKSMQMAIEEVHRRRKVQLDYNQKHGIKPQSIIKPIRDRLVEDEKTEKEHDLLSKELKIIDRDNLLPDERQKLIRQLTKQMKQAAKDLDFEKAVIIRDKIKELKQTQ